MAGYENYSASTQEIEHEIERMGVVLGIDWSDEHQVRSLAREALGHLQDDLKLAASNPGDYRLRAKINLFGLAGIMLKTMTESADYGFQSHGGEAWKAFGKALWSEAAPDDNQVLASD
jgi:hypothetical protein